MRHASQETCGPCQCCRSSYARKLEALHNSLITETVVRFGKVKEEAGLLPLPEAQREAHFDAARNMNVSQDKYNKSRMEVHGGRLRFVVLQFVSVSRLYQRSDTNTEQH